MDRHCLCVATFMDTKIISIFSYFNGMYSFSDSAGVVLEY